MTQPRLVDVVGFVLDKLGLIKDPRKRVPAILAVRAEVAQHAKRFDELLGATLLELRNTSPQPTFAELGELLGATAQHAHALTKAAASLKTATPKGTRRQ